MATTLQLPRWSPAPERLPDRSEYHLDDLLAFADRDFVDQCYRVVLRRPPDPGGMEHYLGHLRRGKKSKVEVVGEIRFSPEGRRQGIRIDGLPLAYTLQRWSRQRPFGRILGWLHGVFRAGALQRRLDLQDSAQGRELHEAGHLLNRVAGELEAAWRSREGAHEALERRLDAALSARPAHADLHALESRLASRDELVALQGVVERLGQALATAERQAAEAAEAARALAGRVNEERTARSNLEARHAVQMASLAAVASRQDALGRTVADLQAALAERAAESKARAGALERAVAALESSVAERMARRDAAMRQDWGHQQRDLARAVEALQSDLEQLRRQQAAAEAFERRMLEDAHRLAEQLAGLDAELSPLVQRLDAGLPRIDALEARIAPVLEAHRAAQPGAAASDAALDAMYAAFEDRFRGSRELIRRRVEPYLDWVREAGAGTREAPVLDLGCGRGEWLEALRDARLHGRGIDRNRVFVDTCRGRGLDVAQADALQALRELPPGSLGALTAIHLVEHLPFEFVVQLLAEARRVLRPGGLLLLETQNPENVAVGACGFYTDPTHRNPIPPEALRWVVEARGFHGVRIERLTLARELGWPGRVAADVPGAATINALSDHFAAAPDYAVRGLRP